MNPQQEEKYVRNRLLMVDQIWKDYQKDSTEGHKTLLRCVDESHDPSLIDIHCTSDSNDRHAKLKKLREDLCNEWARCLKEEKEAEKQKLVTSHSILPTTHQYNYLIDNGQIDDKKRTKIVKLDGQSAIFYSSTSEVFVVSDPNQIPSTATNRTRLSRGNDEIWGYSDGSLFSSTNVNIDFEIYNKFFRQ